MLNRGTSRRLWIYETKPKIWPYSENPDFNPSF